MSQPRISTEQPHTAGVELGNLSTQPQPQPQAASSAVASSQPGPSEYFPSTAVDAPVESQSQDSSMPHISMPPPALTRQETQAIGPSTDLPTPFLPTSSSAAAAGPVIVINLLLSSTGTRHPYKIDEKYLAKRGVAAEGEGGVFDPFVISVYTLKELIWRDWREEWEPKPSSPSAIRLIHFGRMLEDKSPLGDCRFNATTPNVVHMSIKPADTVEEEEATKGGGKGSMSRERRDANERTPGCRCVIL